jgi:hypothetical protein
MKHISIAQEAIAFLWAIANEHPVKVLDDAKNLKDVFEDLTPAKGVYDRAAKKIQKKYRVPAVFRDPQGNERDQFKIPLEKLEEYETELAVEANRRVSVYLRPHTFDMLQSIFTGLFEREDVKAKGVSGDLQMKYIAEVSRAFDPANVAEVTTEQAQNAKDDQVKAAHEQPEVPAA